MPSRGRETPLEHAFSAFLDRRGLTRGEFAKKAGLEPYTLSRLTHRAPTKLPDDLNLDSWAEILQLSAEEKRQLAFAANLTWSTAPIQEVVRTLMKKRS